ncbi:MAG: hypothetical protein ACOX1V_01955 [Candidatus Iainarchaeum sp.]
MDETNEYYSDYDSDNSSNKKTEITTTKKIMIVLLLIFVAIIIIFLAIDLLSQENNRLFFSADGKKFKQSVTISKNGELIDSGSIDGENLVIKSNPQEIIKGKITLPSNKGTKKSGKITITNSGGRITILNNGEGFYINENGEIVFTIDPADLIDWGDYYDENTGEYIFPNDFNYSTTFEIVVIDEETGEEIIIIAPVDFLFTQTNKTSCIELNRTFVNESTHYGSLSVPIKLGVVCEANSNLMSSITWESERMGNVELILENGYSMVLTDYNKSLITSPMINEYPLQIIFTPLKEFAGEKAYFAINFSIDGVESKIDFEVPIDNLEQCIQISSNELIIPKESDSTTLTIDTSTCYSDRITITLCDNDPNCSGGVEGGINLSQTSFTLSPKQNSSKIITIEKDEIPGVYGIPIYARVSGSSKVFIDEKIVLIEPFKGEEVYPEKYVVSLLGTSKDSIQIRNNSLAEDVEVNTSICNLYKNSMGISGTASKAYLVQGSSGGSWWGTLVKDNEKYAGSGKYQAALFNLIQKLDQKRFELQNESTTQNSSIKQAYLLTKDMQEKMTLTTQNNEEMVNDLKNLKEKLEEINKFAELDLVSQLVGLTTSATSIIVSINLLTADVTSVTAATTTMAGSVCPSASYPVGIALEEATKAGVEASSAKTLALTIATTLSSTYNLYSNLISLTKDVESINATSAFNNTKNAFDNMTLAKNEADISLNYAKLALVEASINSFYSINIEDLAAKKNLELVLIHSQNALDYITTAQEYLLDAIDDITIGLPDVQSNVENIIQITAMIVELLTQLPFLELNVDAIITSMTIASGATTEAIALAATECEESFGSSTGCCALASTTGPTALAAMQATNLTGLETLTTIKNTIGIVNGVYGLTRAYQNMTNDYSEDYMNASSKLNELIPKVNETRIALENLINYLPQAIDAADWLGNNSKKISEVANYTSEEYGVGGENYNKKRLNGIIGTALANGFVNGAYQGGVYTTQTNAMGSFYFHPKETLEKNLNLKFASTNDLLEDCENKVTLTLPAYKINLLKDAQKPNLTANGIMAAWDFSDLKVYDVFEEQTADMVFVNSGVKKNVYGVLELPITKHNYENPIQVTGDFGPFDVPNESESVTYKYHMKFNTIPRKSNNYTKPIGENACGVGILRGETASTSSTPRIILSWDWNSVNSPKFSQIQNNSNYSRKINSAIIGTNSKLEPFIDATQLSILISKKLGSLEYYLETAQTTCPINPVEEIIEQIAPIIPSSTLQSYTQGEEIVQKCYLPLTTRDYDGKPALYYYLPENYSQTNYVNENNDETDIQKTSSREELINLLDFNAYLIRDGYGIDFQSDFVVSYSSKLFSTAFSFVNPQAGINNYFYNVDRFFFSSKANSLISKKDWVLPDAGKYRVRLLIDFDDEARLFRVSSPSAKIIVVMDLIEPVNTDYSPLYYTPIDGFTGLSANNNRIGYGSSITSGAEFPITNYQGITISSNQKKSLYKLTHKKITDFFTLNALPSMRSKILDHSLSPNDNSSTLIFTPTTINPIIFEIKETIGQRPILNYSFKRDTMDISSKMNSSIISSTLKGCKDYSNEQETTFINNGPDVGDGKIYGDLLPISQKEGVNYVKTIIYAPTNAVYSIKNPEMKVYTPNSINATETNTILSGINSMPKNHSSIGETINSLEDILLGVEKGSICVSKLGTREVYYWPEEQIFEEKYVGKEYTNLIQNAQNNCLKGYN